MEKLKVFVKRKTEARINGKPYTVQEGLQELDRDLAELLLNVGIASLPPSPPQSTQPKEEVLPSAEPKADIRPPKRSRK